VYLGLKRGNYVTHVVVRYHSTYVNKFNLNGGHPANLLSSSTKPHVESYIVNPPHMKTVVHEFRMNSE
jgi:hypothetical protein